MSNEKSDNSDNGRTFLDNLFDKAEDAISAVEKIVDGGRGVLPLEKDGERLIADSMTALDDDGYPEVIVLRRYDRNGQSTTRRYRIESGRARGRVIEIGVDR